MRCPQCGFHNLPNLTQCGRCGSALGGGNVALAEVTPPRANKRRTSWRNVGYRWSDHWGAFKERLPSGRIQLTLASDVDPTSVPFVTLLIPGFAQRWLGFPVRAALFFWSWALLFGYGVLGVGMPFAATAIGLAIGIHVSAILDLFMGQLEGILLRLGAIAATYIATALCFYYPLYLGVCQFVQPIALARHYGPLQQDDAALVYRWSAMRPGDIVAVTVDRLGWWGAGTELATLIGFPGDQVVVGSNRVTVNGDPIRLYSTDQIQSITADVKTTVPDGELLVILSEQRRAAGRLVQGNYALRSLPRREVLGRVAYVTGPIGRRGAVPRPEEAK